MIVKYLNSVNTVVVISKNLIKDTKFNLLIPTVNTAEKTHFMVTKKELAGLETSIRKDKKIKLETVITQLDNRDFVLLQFEKYSESQITFLADKYDNYYKQFVLFNDIKINFDTYKDYCVLTLKQNHDTLKLSLFSTLLFCTSRK